MNNDVYWSTQEHSGETELKWTNQTCYNIENGLGERCESCRNGGHMENCIPMIKATIRQYINYYNNIIQFIDKMTDNQIKEIDFNRWSDFEGIIHASVYSDELHKKELEVLYKQMDDLYRKSHNLYREEKQRRKENEGK